MHKHEGTSPIPVVHVVEDDDSFRNSLIRMLTAHGIAAVGYRCAGEFLLADVLDTPGCILLDVSMPGPSGLDLLRALSNKRTTPPPIIFLTGHDDVSTTVDAMKWGALDYLVKPADVGRLLQSVQKAIDLDAHRRAERRELIELRQRFDQLTPLERRILAGIMNNRLNKQLAAEFGACERTIKAQRARIRRKLQIRSLPDLVRASRLLERYESENGKADESGRTSGMPRVARRIPSSPAAMSF
ncbi:MAG: response regulator transcription factor [Povalibacter sp.]|jgi:FixJ family two-component response regulator